MRKDVACFLTVYLKGRSSWQNFLMFGMVNSRDLEILVIFNYLEVGKFGYKFS